MLPKITITIEGPSVQGIGKTMVCQIIQRELKRYGYEVKHSVIPGADNPVPVTREAMLHLEQIREGISNYETSPEDSRPRATINIVEHT